MTIEVLKSKIHRVKVTDADLNYIGSITIDVDLMKAANVAAAPSEPRYARCLRAFTVTAAA